MSIHKDEFSRIVLNPFLIVSLNTRYINTGTNMHKTKGITSTVFSAGDTP